MSLSSTALIGVIMVGTVLGASVQGGSATASRRETLPHDGLLRQYELHVPATASASAPLVVVLHGGGFQDDPIAMIRNLTRFDAKAAAVGALVVYPLAIEHYWNDGRGLGRYRAQADGVDDVGFVVALVEHLATARGGIDASRVYVAGASNGAMMAYRLACERPERFTAIGVVAGNLPAALPCRPARPIAVISLNGTADPLMPWEGGEVRFGAQRLGQVLSIPDTMDRWASLNGCARPPAEDRLPNRAPLDGTRVDRVAFRGCDAGADVVFYRVEGGGHTWPGGPQETSRAVVGRTSRDIDATEVMWSFFAGHRRPARGDAP